MNKLYRWSDYQEHELRPGIIFIWCLYGQYDAHGFWKKYTPSRHD